MSLLIKQKFSHRWIEAIKQLSPVILSLSNSSENVLVTDFIGLVELSLKNRGEVSTLKDLKSYRVYLQQHICKQQVTPLSFRKVDKDGFPKVLKPWKSLANGDLEQTRLCLSIWRLIDCFRMKPNDDTSSITDPSSGSKELIDEISTWVKSWEGLKVLPKRLPTGDIILSNRAGPNGPATASAMDDLEALKRDNKLHRAVGDLLRLNPGIRLEDYSCTKGTFKHSKLVFLSDKAGKTRVIAIGDWWSNVALSPIHKAFMAGLRELGADCTFRQDQIPNLIKGLGSNLYTSDMTAFTDRFPLEIEKAVVSAAYGSKIGDLWSTVIRDRYFETPKGPVKYSVGNPMGLLSSWAVSSFTHHAVKQWCASKITNKRYKYLLLGDDCLDTSKEVFTKYLDTITRLGVGISLGKCTQSENSYAEFAKRIFTPSGETTGLPVELLEGISKKPEQFIELVRIMRNRGYSEQQIVPGVRSLLQQIPKKVSKVVLFVLSSPESILGMPPLIMEGNYLMIDPPLLSSGLSGDFLDKHIEQARREVFWEEVDKIVQPGFDSPGTAPPKRGYRKHIPENHPALIKLSDQLMVYLQDESSEYSVYEKWMSGESYDMVLVPSIELYRYRNRAHKASKSRYEIIKRARAFALGLRDYRTTLPEKISNFELFQKGFPQD